MRLSDDRFDSMVRRELQDATAAWHAPQWRGPARRRARLSPLAGAALVVVAAAALGVAVARPLVPRQTTGSTAPSGGGPVRPAADFPLGIGGSLAWDERRGVGTLFAVGNGRGPDGQSSMAPGIGSTWTWTAASGWQRAGSGPTPPPRIGAAMAYDPASGDELLYGGSFASAGLADTWRWDGAHWQRLAAGGPGPGPALMCWDATAGHLLLVAADPGGTSWATWAWDGSTWRHLGSAPGHATVMAYDPAARAPVLVTTAAGDAPQATWTLHGSAWTRVAGAPPLLGLTGADIDAVYLAADTTTGGLILVGQGAGPHPETWAWSPGQPWTRAADTPDPWAGGIMAGPRSATVLFGGPNSVGAFAHAWRWQGGRWVEVTRGG